ncbi:MAG: fluoride efflux transporter CrcB [Gammaproteobacteria bacterium]
MIKIVAAVGFGGAVGAIARYGLSSAAHHVLGHDFPVGSLFVNLLGSLAIGFLYFFLLDRFPANHELRGLLIIGFLGGLTTFSAFAFEVLVLLENSAWLKSFLYMLASVAGCVTMAWLGMLAARQF